VKVQETVSDEARGDQWEVRSINKVQHRYNIFKEERVGERARMTIDEERVLCQG